MDIAEHALKRKDSEFIRDNEVQSKLTKWAINITLQVDDLKRRVKKLEGDKIGDM